jgi:hypothetical protein
MAAGPKARDSRNALDTPSTVMAIAIREPSHGPNSTPPSAFNTALPGTLKVCLNRYSEQ